MLLYLDIKAKQNKLNGLDKIIKSNMSVNAYNQMVLQSLHNIIMSKARTLNNMFSFMAV